jgi:hypothetical protein
VIDVVVFVVLTVTVAAPLCGNQGQPWPLAPPWEAVAAAVAASRALRALGEGRAAPSASEGLLGAPGSAGAPTRGPSSVASSRQNAPQASSAPFPAPGSERASEARQCPRHAPTWARKEAA